MLGVETFARYTTLYVQKGIAGVQKGDSGLKSF